MIGHRHDYSWPEFVLTFWATLTLAILAVTSLVLRYVTNPLSCFLPPEFSPSSVDYARQFCFHSDALLAPDDAGSADAPSRHTYHQWLPFFLGVTALLCLLPHLASRLLSPFLWLDLHQLLTSLLPPHHPHRHALLRHSALLLQAGLRGGNSMLARAALGRKALGGAVCFLQMVLMVAVFPPQLGRQDDDHTEEGFMASGNDSVPLPVHSFVCTFAIRQLARIHRFQVVCFMPLAQVYTKGLLFLVLCFLILFLLFVADLTLCALRLFAPRLKDLALLRFLSLPSQSHSQGEGSGPAHLSTSSQSESQVAGDDPAQLSGFLAGLGVDGRWVVGVVGDTCGALTAADLTLHLWQVFKESPPLSQAPSAVVTSPADCSAAVSGSPKSADCGADTGTIPMVAIGDKDGDSAQGGAEKEKI